jgi:hypothetical protein
MSYFAYIFYPQPVLLRSECCLKYNEVFRKVFLTNNDEICGDVEMLHNRKHNGLF